MPRPESLPVMVGGGRPSMSFFGGGHSSESRQRKRGWSASADHDDRGSRAGATGYLSNRTPDLAFVRTIPFVG